MSGSAALDRAMVAVLRERAAALVALAGVIEGARVSDLVPAAGPDTWLGPIADAFCAEMRVSGGRLGAAATGLRVAAWRLSEEADRLTAELARADAVQELLRAGVR